jgi:hypothetical protein
LIATAGRPSLRKLLDSLKDQLTERDAITIVFDGEGGKAKSGIQRDWLKGHQSQIQVHEQTPNLGFWGHGIRSKYQGILSPKCTYIMHADDDDFYHAGAFAKLRKLCKDPNILYIGKFERVYDHKPTEYFPPHGYNTIEIGKIGTPCGIIPWNSAAKAKWGEYHGGDGQYYLDLKDHVAGHVFLDEVMYSVKGR